MGKRFGRTAWKLNSLLAVAALLLTQACGKRLQIAEGCANGFYETTEGQRLVWPDGSRVEFSIDSSVPENFHDAFLASAEAYTNTLESTDVRMTNEQTIPPFRGDTSKLEEDGINGVYWLNDDQWLWKEKKPGAIAVTVTTFSSSRISGADVYFRASSFERKQRSKAVTAQNSVVRQLLPKFKSLALPMMDLFEATQPNRNIASAGSIASAAYDPSSDNKNYSEHHVYMVSVHEIGHALGRCHSSEPASIMFPSVGSGTEAMREAPLDEIDLDIFSSAYKLFAEAE